MSPYLMIRFLIFSFLLFYVTACVPLADLRANNTTPAGSTPIASQTATLNQPEPTERPTAQAIPTARSRPVLISYTIYTDGGDDLFTCLKGFNQPLFILFEDGELLVLRSGYKQTNLTREERNRLLQRIADTRLLEQPVEKYGTGFSELSLFGQRFYYENYSNRSDPFWQATDILERFEPEDMQPYVPENLILVIYSVEDVQSIADYFPGPIPLAVDWTGSPLQDYGLGWHVISSPDVAFVLKEFAQLPDIRLFSHGDQTYVAQICAIFAWQ